MDTMIRATDKDLTFRLFAVKTTDLVEEARKMHETLPTATAAIGRLLTIGLMMGYTMKNDHDKITVKLAGGGPLGNLLVTADSKGHVKGYVQDANVDLPRKENGKLDVGSAVGNKGEITVIKDIGMGEPYVGKSDIVTGEIAEDLALYYFLSEQTSSAIAAGVLVNPDETVKSAGGLILQPLPNCPQEKIIELEQFFKEFKNVSETFASNDSTADIMLKLFEKFDIKINEEIAVKYKCDCSEDRIEKVLIAMGREELETIINEDTGAEVNCQFCNKNYQFTTDDLKKLL